MAAAAAAAATGAYGRAGADVDENGDDGTGVRRVTARDGCDGVLFVSTRDDVYEIGTIRISVFLSYLCRSVVSLLISSDVLIRAPDGGLGVSVINAAVRLSRRANTTCVME